MLLVVIDGEKLKEIFVPVIATFTLRPELPQFKERSSGMSAAI
jgi:hypothetical protein